MDKLPNKNLDIQSILEKITNLPIDPNDKATILEEIKKNITHPSAGENKNLDDIQAKYINTRVPMNMDMDMNSNQQQMMMPNMLNSNMPNMSNSNMQNMPNNNMMTVAHFDVLRNKLDSLQFELIDLLRHVKDYTQRYMNAIRQQDLDKINEYINTLFEVDKQLKETKALADNPPIDEADVVIEPEDDKSIITKTTSGITNFFGNIGKNVSSITDMVKSTADVASGYLNSKPKDTSNASVSATTSGSTSNATVSTNINTISANSNSINNVNNVNIKKANGPVSRNKNIVSVDEYMSYMDKSDMDKINKGIYNSNILSNSTILSSSNNINALSNRNRNNESTGSTGSTGTTGTTETQSEDLEGALKNLNHAMNQDIEKTVNSATTSSEQSSNPTTTSTSDEEAASQVNQLLSEETQTGGGRRNNKMKHMNQNYSNKENRLSRKINLLKMKLTKKKLLEQLGENNKTSIHNKKKVYNIIKHNVKHNVKNNIKHTAKHNGKHTAKHISKK